LSVFKTGSSWPAAGLIITWICFVMVDIQNQLGAHSWRNALWMRLLRRAVIL
jgi:hypothetical protein